VLFASLPTRIAALSLGALASVPRCSSFFSTFARLSERCQHIPLCNTFLYSYLYKLKIIGLQVRALCTLRACLSDALIADRW
jgi:hypothetical protein